MHTILSKLLPVAILLSVAALPGRATLVNSSVNGSLTFAGDPSNYFDPNYGFVPSTGYLNIFGTTVTISNSAVEFGFDDGSSLITANFSDTQFTIKDLVETPGPTNGFEMIFTDSALTGQYLIPASAGSPLSSFSLVGNVMKLEYPGGNPAMGQTLSAGFTLAPVPEPSTFGSLSVSVLVALAVLFVFNLRSKLAQR